MPDPNKAELNAKSRRLTKSAKVAIALVLLLVVGYIVQQSLKPAVDPTRIKPVVVSDRKETPDAAITDEAADLPDGAVTAVISQAAIDQAEHPFDPLLIVAERSIEEIDKHIRDYTATLVSQVRVGGVLQPEKYLHVKIRHQQLVDGQEIPFSVYTLFLKPEDNVGQEAIWVAGRNDGNLIAHATGLLNVKKFYLDPDGAIAMKGNRYPIREIGVRNLIVKMAEIGRKDREHGECEVTIKRKIDVNGIPCTMLEAVHPVERPHFEYHIARIYIDDARNIPIAYEGFLWPENEGEDPVLLEKYYYTDLKINVSLTDKDFDPENEEYNYPKW